MKSLQNFIYALLSVAIVAIISSYFTRHGIAAWYHNAVPSRFTPPDSVFPVVWSVLYFLMVLSFYGILQLPDKNQTLDARLIFLSQLLLNIVWCFSFFLCQTVGGRILHYFSTGLSRLPDNRRFSKIAPRQRLLALSLLFVVRLCDFSQSYFYHKQRINYRFLARNIKILLDTAQTLL